MPSICDNLTVIREQIRSYCAQYARAEDSVRLLAVSKTKPIEAIQDAIDCEQRAFGENYVQEMVEKTQYFSNPELDWHFIGPLQSNKSRLVAATASWMHTVDRLKIAQRLNEQRPAHLPPLNICLQVNISRESSKSGLAVEDLPELVDQLQELRRLSLRGLMAIPAPSDDFSKQRRAFAALREALEDLQLRGFDVDTLSMGMTNDLEAAIAEGATLVRIGTAIFGRRETPT